MIAICKHSFRCFKPKLCTIKLIDTMTQSKSKCSRLQQRQSKIWKVYTSVTREHLAHFNYRILSNSICNSNLE